MTQLDLIPEPPQGAARRTDPETSQKAARDLRPGGLERLILDALKIHADGLTIAELAVIIDRKEVSVSPRIAQLRARNLLRDSGRRRRNTGCKVEATVWVIA